MKVLFVASIAKHILRFHLPYLQMLKKWGCEIHVACGDVEQIPYCDKIFDVNVFRSPYNLRNIKAYFFLKRIVKSGNYNLIHCHTPVASILTRLASIGARKSGTKILYTAHGFHFFKGSPKHFWFLFYPVEKFLSKFTDGIITINTEDYNVANNFFYSNSTFLISGVGVDTIKFKPISIDAKYRLRESLDYSEDCFILFYAAEFIKRKNHRFIIQSISILKNKIPSLKILFAGRGLLQSSIQDYVKELDVAKYVDFLGFRNDINDLISISDVGISASKQEGLGINLIEEMLSGLPVIATRDRGHEEIINHGFNGYLYEQGDINKFCEYVLLLYNDKMLRLKLGLNAHQDSQKFSIDHSLSQMEKIYKLFLNYK